MSFLPGATSVPSEGCEWKEKNRLNELDRLEEKSLDTKKGRPPTNRRRKETAEGKGPPTP